MDSITAVLPFIVILLAFWLLIIRPSRNRQRAQRDMQQNLAVGQQVMLTAGLFGEVAAIEDDAVVIQTAPGVTMRWAKPAVARILTPKEPDAGDDEVRDPVEADGTDSAERRSE